MNDALTKWNQNTACAKLITEQWSREQIIFMKNNFIKSSEVVYRREEHTCWNMIVRREINLCQTANPDPRVHHSFSSDSCLVYHDFLSSLSFLWPSHICFSLQDCTVPLTFRQLLFFCFYKSSCYEWVNNLSSNNSINVTVWKNYYLFPNF